MYNTVQAQELQNERPPIYIVQKVVTINKPKCTKSHGAGIVTHAERVTDHSADPFVRVEDINRIVEYGLKNKAYGKVALFVFGINTGYRCGDALAFRVCDFYDKNGNFADVFNISEDKTGKVRSVYINKAVKTAVELAIKKKGLTEENYVFRTDGNKRTYLKEFKYDGAGNIMDVITSPNKYDADGNLREVAPFTMSNIIKWLKKTSAELGIYGHYSSHAMRKTFAEHISRNFEDNKNVLAASVALAHSSVKTTLEYYMSVDPNRLREKWLELNLGLEALERFNTSKQEFAQY